MIDKQVLKKFVVGLGSDLEVDLCESYLEDCDAAGSDSVLDLQLDQETKSDSLIQSLRNSGKEVEPFEDVTNEIQTCIQARLETTDIVKFLRPPKSNDEIGRIGPYRLLKKIGAGGMGIVFRAENIESGSVVALKVMNPMMASNPLAAERFQREVRSAAKLDHARIIKIHDIGRDAGIPFFAMELLQGRPLGQHIEQRGRLPASEVKQLVTQIAEGLDYASQHGILHRDIKPDNLWLTDEGDVIILDFGLARGKDDTAGLTNTGDVLGTPRYMAPEQVKGQSTDHRTDLFSLGSVMYEMLTGASKFADENVFASMMAVTQRAATPDELTALGCPTPLAKLTCKLLAKEPDGRPDSAALVIQELEKMDLSPAILTENHGSQTGSNWPKYVAILVGVPLFVALAIIIYVQTDRGTLVIKAEPGVEITTEDHGGVKIRLVDSDKTYNISVGTRLLPSGSYEIVVDDENDEFSFSTPQFVIRRGQQELVTISLKQVDANTRADAEMDNAFAQKYAFVAQWFESNPELFDENIFALALVAETDGRDFVFKLEGGIDKANDGFEIKKTRFHYSIDELFGSHLQIMRAGKIIGDAQLLDDLPLNDGEKREHTSYIGRLDQSDTDNVILQNEDVVVVRRDLTSTTKGMASIDNRPNVDPNPWDRGDKIREFLAKKFPDVDQFYVGSVTNVSQPLVRFDLDRYFDLTNKRPRSGEEYFSRGSNQTPSLNGKKAHIYAGIERIGYGKVTGLLGEGRDNFLEIQNLLTEEPQLTRGRAIVIPATDHKDPIRFDSESNLAVLPALSILKTLGLKHGEPLSELAMVSDPSAKSLNVAHDFESWTIETKHHRSRINDMSINFKQDLVAIAGDDAIVRVWNLNNDLPQQELDERQIKPTLGYVLPCRLPAKRVCWSPTGNIVAVATRDPIRDTGSVLIWRLANNKAELIRRLEIQASELAFCPLGSRIAVHSQDSVSVFDLSSTESKEIFSFEADEMTRCAWSTDGKTLACTRSEHGKRNVILINVEKATLESGGNFVFRKFLNCHNAGFTKCSNGVSIFSIVQNENSNSHIAVYDGKSLLLPIETAPINSNSKIAYRENHRNFFRVDTHVGLNHPKVQSIFRASIDRRAELPGAVQFEKLESPELHHGISAELQNHFVVDRKSNLFDARQFTGRSGDKWFHNLIPTEHDPANGLTFQLHVLDDAVTNDSAQISARNILNGEYFSGPKMIGISQLALLTQKGAVAASPNGTRIAFLGPDIVRIYDLKNNSSNEYPIEKFNGSPPRLYWSIDSKSLIVQHLSESSLTIIAPDFDDSATKIKADANARGMGFIDTSDRVLLDRERPNRIFWRHRSDGVGFFDIETGRKLVEYVIQPRADGSNKIKGSWIASYDWHQASGRICLLIRDSMLENKSRLEIHQVDGQTIELVETIELNSQITSDAKPVFATFDATADHVVLFSEMSDEASHKPETSYRAFKIDLRTQAIKNIGTIMNSSQEFLTNRRVVLSLSGAKATVLSIDDSKIQSVPFAKDSLKNSRSLSKFGDQWLLICGRQISLFDENFRLLSTFLKTTPGPNEGVSLTNDGVANHVELKGHQPVELILVGVRDSELIIEPYAVAK